MSRVHAGDRINNYILESPVGTGSFGEVWRARHHVFGTVVAVKIPTDQQYVRNLQREGLAVHGLHHPNIVRVLDLDPYADPPYLVMEFVDGPSLREAIDASRGQFPIVTAFNVLRGLLGALAAAHQAGLIHRDVKPSNILLHHPLSELESLPETAVRVADFGLGRVGGDLAQSMMHSGSLLTSEGRSISGTIAYMSPEQREGHDIDARSDLYSCGIVLYEMITGERPQGTDLPSQVRGGVPTVLDRVFQRSYTRLDRRYASAQEMLAALGPTPVRKPVVRKPAPPMVPTSAARAGECADCGGEVRAGDQFCIHCGSQLSAGVPRCPQCRAFVDASDLYCIFCGVDLRVLSS